MNTKIYITALVSLVAIAITASAQECYYYHKGNKILLRRDDSKVVVVTPKSRQDANAPQRGRVIKEIYDERYDIKVCEATANPAFGLNGSNGIQEFPCYFDAVGNPAVPTGYIVVKLKSSSDYAILEKMANSMNLEILPPNEFLPLWYGLRSDNANPVEAANAIWESGLVASSAPDFLGPELDVSYDPLVTQQWGLYNKSNPELDISVSQAWNYSTGWGVKIAIIDEGVDRMHGDLHDNIYILNHDTEGSLQSQVYGVHGTHCAGIAAAVRNNGYQVAGVAPDSKIMVVSSRFGSGLSGMKLASGINWAWRNGADVISCSWGGGSPSEVLEAAIDSALMRGRGGLGCVFVKSAGNTAGSISYPGNYRPEIITVANMQSNGSLSVTSAYGNNLFVTAPGTDILSTVPNDGVHSYSGTSMACPHVAGIAALILARNPGLTQNQVRAIIGQSARKVGTLPYANDNTKPYGTWNQHYGYGLVDAFRAIIQTPRN